MWVRSFTWNSLFNYIGNTARIEVALNSIEGKEDVLNLSVLDKGKDCLIGAELNLTEVMRLHSALGLYLSEFEKI